MVFVCIINVWNELFISINSVIVLMVRVFKILNDIIDVGVIFDSVGVRFILIVLIIYIVGSVFYL